MTTDSLDFSLLQKPLAGAKNILIILAASPKLDMAAAGLALYLSLKKQGKNVSIACPTAMTVAFNRLIGVNKISSQIGNRNLLISFDYIKDSIEKVSYNIENNKFNLVVEPKTGFPPLDKDKVSYSYTGVSAEVIFIIGAQKLSDLQGIYQQNKKNFTDSLTVNIDNSPNNSSFAKINFCDPQVSAISEIAAFLIKELNMPIDEDVATNLYSGIKSNSANFQSPNVNANTFEIAAFLLKNGAKKDQLTVKAFTADTQPASASFSQPATKTNPAAEPKAVFSPLKPSQPQPPFVNNKEKSKKPQPPPDWFKPKIYKGDKPV